ncbi:MAG TPA: DUF6349 family protein [Microbacterium sp.]|nr:DUF6349 family protein [Microbacterium sp.]
MSSYDGGQLAFDFDELAREDARANLSEWQGAPLRFTLDYYPPAALDEAFAHWCFLNTHFDSYSQSHMWHRAIVDHDDLVVADGAHVAASFTAELRPRKGHEGPGELLTKMVCEPCAWQIIDESENHAVEAWHDHAFPGWRELPVVPFQIRVRTEKGMSKLARAWIAERYPAEAQTPGAPIITERPKYGTRHVRGYSPWGGYDLSSTALKTPALRMSQVQNPSPTPPTPILPGTPSSRSRQGPARGL